MVSKELVDKIVRNSGYTKAELKAAGIEFKEGWRKKFLKERHLVTRQQTPPPKEFELPQSGYIYRETGSGVYHVIVNRMLLCRRAANPRRQIISENEPKDLPLCLNCKDLLSSDPGNRRQEKFVGNAFYQSWEWKKARYETIKRYGAVCMCCGSEQNIVVDHIKPRRFYPALELNLENLQVLCRDCNQGKSFDDETDFRPRRSAAEIAELEIMHEGSERMH